MKNAPIWYIAIATLSLTLLLPGCDRTQKNAPVSNEGGSKRPRKARGKQAEEASAASNAHPGGVLSPANFNPGIAKNLPIVGRAVTQQMLQQLALLYVAEQPPPRKLEDMPTLARDLPRLYQAIRDGSCIVNWGLRPGIDPSQAILAYERDVPTQGGNVVLLSTTPANYTPEQFQASPKVGAAR